jgi:hypothetical protein
MWVSFSFALLLAGLAAFAHGLFPEKVHRRKMFNTVSCSTPETDAQFPEQGSTITSACNGTEFFAQLRLPLSC